MTASLYQSASSAARPDDAAGSIAGDFSSFIFGGSKVVVEILLAAHAPPQSEYVRWCAQRVEHDVVMPSPPDVTLVAQQIVHLVRLLGIECQRLDVEVDPPGLRLMRVEVHHGQDDVAGGGVYFQVGDQLLVIDGAEVQSAVGLQCGIFAAD